MRLLAAALGALAWLAAGPAQAQEVELLASGSFDTAAALDDWSAFGGPGSSVTWDAMDVDDSPGSGSMRVEVDPSDSGNAVNPQQCLGVVGGGSYDFGASVFQPSSSPVASAFVRVQWFRETDCADPVGGADTSDTSVVDAWAFLSRVDVLAPADARSARFSLTTFEDFDQLENLVAFWDEATFVPEPSPGAAALAAAWVLGLCRRRRGA